MPDVTRNPVRKYPFLPADPDIGWLPYAWLTYLVWFFVYPAIVHASALVWILSIGAGIIFLPLYFTGYWVRSPKALWVSAGMAAVGIAILPWNPTGTMFFVYAAADGAHTVADPKSVPLRSRAPGGPGARKLDSDASRCGMGARDSVYCADRGHLLPPGGPPAHHPPTCDGAERSQNTWQRSPSASGLRGTCTT